MPAILHWLLRLLPTNPICMRLVQVGSRQLRHLYIRAGYLAVMVLVLLFVLLGRVQGGSLSLRELAGAGANMFEQVSYLQVTLICLLTPVFMAGAIAQEANPRTWDILLTTPLNNLQIVLGNLFGRLFFVIALLFSSLPLFVMVQYFGGVPGESIFASYAIAGMSAMTVAAIAVTLSVTRTAGRRAVLIFYFAVILYLFATFAADRLAAQPVPNSTTAVHTSVFTPLNPFLALRVLLGSNDYQPYDFTGQDVGWLRAMWLGRPVAAFLWLCLWTSLVLVVFSTIQLRLVGARAGKASLLRRMVGLPAKGAMVRTPRTVGHNPVSWRERVARGKTLPAIVGRWGFVAVGIVLAGVLLLLVRVGTIDIATTRIALVTVLSAEIVVIALAALNLSATAVSREREDGSLDIILTTPIQPGPYLTGKLLGLLQFLGPMMLVPTLTVALFALYVLLDGFGVEGGVMVVDPNPKAAANFAPLPFLLPEGAIALPVMLVPFIAFCVMVGLHWSIRSRGTISSMIAAVGIVLAVTGVLTLCARVGGQEMSILGSVLAPLSPVNMTFALVYPAEWIPSALDDGMAPARLALAVSSAVAAALYTGIAIGMHASMKRGFMMTVRRLSGTR